MSVFSGNGAYGVFLKVRTHLSYTIHFLENATINWIVFLTVKGQIFDAHDAIFSDPITLLKDKSQILS